MKKRTISLLMALALLLSLWPTMVFAADEQITWRNVSEFRTTENYTDEYYRVKAPMDEDNTIYVDGKAAAGTKVLLISLQSFKESKNYIRVFVVPEENGEFSVAINTAPNNSDAPTATQGTVLSAGDKAYDSRPGYKAMESMPVGLYRLNITTAKTDADADVCGSNKEWYKGTLGGNYGYALQYVIFAVTGENNDPKLIEFSDSVSTSRKIQDSEDLSDANVYARYMDVRLKDFSYILKDSNTLKEKPMTAQQADYIHSVAEEVTDGATTDFEKLTRIYYYIADNFYYDSYARDLYSSQSVNIQCCNPYDNLYNLRNHVASRNSTADGKVATVCDGYASMVISMCRSLGIPARAIGGSKNNYASGVSATLNKNKITHSWAEAYVDGRWVTVDANYGSNNYWTRTSETDTGTWTYNGTTVYGLDMSDAARTSMYCPVYICVNSEGRPFVQNVAATQDGDTGKPKITWTPLDGYSRYYIYRNSTGNYFDNSYYDTTYVAGSYIDVNAVPGQIYYYMIRPVDSESKEGTPSDVVSSTCRDSTNALTVESPADGKGLRLRWTHVDGAQKYNIYRGYEKSNIAFWKNPSDEVYRDTTAAPGTVYYYYVRPVFADGTEGAATNTVSFRTAGRTASAPAAPTGVKASYNSDSGKPYIKWDAVSNATSYELYRSESQTSGYTRIFTTDTATNYLDKDARVGGSYYYKVTALRGAASSEFSASVVGKCHCIKPTITSAVHTSNGNRITWNAVDGAVSYYVLRGTSDPSTIKWVKTVSGTTYEDKEAPANEIYYKVTAVASDRDCNSADSDARACEQRDEKLSAPTGVKTANNSSNGRVKVSWAAVTGAAKYEVWYAASKSGTYRLLTTTKSTSCTDSKNTGVGKTYYYKVKALGSNAGSNSDFSAVKSGCVHCAKPVVTLSNVASSGRVKVSWKAVTGAAKYEVWYAASKSGTYRLLTTTKSTSYTDSKNTGVAKTYYYKVKALGSNTSSNSDFSAVKSCCVKCARPTVTLSNIAAGKAKVSWKAVTGAQSYDVYRAISKSGTYTKVATQKKGSTYYTNTKLMKGKTYYYKVIARGAVKSADSAYSTIVSVKIVK